MFRNLRALLGGLAVLALVALASFLPSDANATGAISPYLQGKIYGVTLQGAAFTAPTTVYMAIGTGTFTAGTCTGEVSGGSYARVAVTANTTNFVVASGSLSNGTTITFPAPTAAW